MRDQRHSIARSFVVFLATTTLVACSSGGDGGPTGPAAVATVAISPSSPSLAIGGTVQLTATPRDANGNALTGRTVTWSSTANNIATVSGGGLVTAVGAGTAQIRATSDGVVGETSVTVTQPPVVSVTLSQTTGTLVPGQSLKLTATARDGSGGALGGRAITWSSLATSVATVDNDGNIAGVAAGNATIRATSEGKTVDATITVEPGAFIGAAGGTAIAPPVTVVIPANALTAGTAITIKPATNPPAHASLVPGTAFQLGPEGTTFAQPVTVRIVYETSQLPGGAIPELLRVHRWNGTAWVALANPTADVPTRTISGTTTQFSIFALIQMPANGVPTLGTINPTSAIAGTAAFTLTVQGTGFVNGAQVRWNGNARTTTFVSSTQLTAQISAADIAAQGTVPVTVFNPAPGGGTSGAVNFTINPPAPPPPAVTNRLSAGGEYTCGLSGNRAFCWGVDEYGQLGKGWYYEQNYSAEPVLVLGGHNFSLVSHGESHSCGVAGTTAFCWGGDGGGEGESEGSVGDGYFGRLGTGTTYHRSMPATVVGGHAFATTAAGGTHSCGITTAGQAFCWGGNEYGQLGNNSTNNSAIPVAVSGGHTFASITTGEDHTCAITAGGSAFCWGYGTEGTLGNNVAAHSSVPVAVSGGHSFVEITAAWNHTCARTNANVAYCWGMGANGRLGNGGIANALVPSLVSGGGTYISISAGTDHTCGVRTGGAAYCWGFNGQGQHGRGNQVQSTTPMAVSGGHTFTSISAGQGHSCGVTAAGSGYCWGQNSWGQLGDGTFVDRLIPTLVTGGHQYTTINAGMESTCSRSTTGQAWCWGNANKGQLGNGWMDYPPTPRAVEGNRDFKSIFASWYHTCALTPAGAAYCWGENSEGQLGLGHLNHAESPLGWIEPRAVIGGHTYSLLATGENHACGLTTNGAVYCWGNNSSGQLGNGSNVRSATPVPVSGGHVFTSITAGGDNTCGITNGGQAFCWGHGVDGTLGNGANVNSNVPVPVSGGHTWTQLTTGWEHTCGLTTGGIARCWGYGNTGELGSGTAVGSNVPVTVAGGFTFSVLSAAYGHTCGLTPTGTALCWGWGSEGQLGNDDYVNKNPTPQMVSGGRTFASISAGGYHTCGLTTMNVLYCWGNGGKGQTGTSNWDPQFPGYTKVPNIVDGGVNFGPTGAAVAARVFGGTRSGGRYTRVLRPGSHVGRTAPDRLPPPGSSKREHQVQQSQVKRAAGR